MATDRHVTALLPSQNASTSEPYVHARPTPDEKHVSTRDRLKGLGTSAKSMTLKVLHVDDTPRQLDIKPNELSYAIKNDAELNPSLKIDPEASVENSIKKKLFSPNSAKEFKETVRHPRKACREQASESLAVSEDPHLGRGDDIELINVHEKLVGAQEQLKHIDEWEPQYSVAKENAARLRCEIDVLEQDREAKRVAWVSSNYVHCIKVMPAQSHDFPLLSSCRWVDQSGTPQGRTWAQWIEQVTNLVNHIPQGNAGREAVSGKETKQSEYDQDMLLQEVERIIVSSGPIQRYILTLRRLHDWHTPTASVTWLVVWLSAWTFNRLFTFLYLFAACRILQQRTNFAKREALEEAQNRASDDNQPYRTFSEMIERLGSANWLKPAIEQAGPVAQPILRNTADWLEVFVSYLEWKTPRAIYVILAFLGSLILVATLFGTETLFRAFTLSAIIGFFIDAPLESTYPGYKRVLLPLHWVFWNIPTKTETAFKHLRTRAVVAEQEMAAKHGGRAASVNVELFATECTCEEKEGSNTLGSVVLTTSHIYFIRRAPRLEMWRQPFADIVELRKGEGRKSLMSKTKHIAEMGFKDGTTRKLLHVQKNDMLFNIIFAFSGLQWRQEET